MTTSPEHHTTSPSVSLFWQPDVVAAFANLCQDEGLNPVRTRKLVDATIETDRKPSRQELIDALKRRPRIQERAALLSSMKKKLHTFITTYT